MARGARLALSLVLNIEEGAESHVMDGDPAAECLNSDMICGPWPRRRYLVMESHFEYGSRAGVWRLLDLFRARGQPITAFSVGLGLKRCPAIAARLAEDGHEVAAHGCGGWITATRTPRPKPSTCARRSKQLSGCAAPARKVGIQAASARRLVG